MRKAGLAVAGALVMIGAATVQAVALDLMARPAGDRSVQRVSLPMPAAPARTLPSRPSLPPLPPTPPLMTELAELVPVLPPETRTEEAVYHADPPATPPKPSPSPPPSRWRDVSHYTGGTWAPAAPPPPAVPLVPVEVLALAEPKKAVPSLGGWAARVAFPDH